MSTAFVDGMLNQLMKWKCVNFKCYSSEELITLNTLHEVVPTWYSFHSWVDWSNADKVSCSRRKHIDAGIEPSTFVSKVDIQSTTPIVHSISLSSWICQLASHRIQSQTPSNPSNDQQQPKWRNPRNPSIQDNSSLQTNLKGGRTRMPHHMCKCVNRIFCCLFNCWNVKCAMEVPSPGQRKILVNDWYLPRGLQFSANGRLLRYLISNGSPTVRNYPCRTERPCYKSAFESVDLSENWGWSVIETTRRTVFQKGLINFWRKVENTTHDWKCHGSCIFAK